MATRAATRIGFVGATGLMGHGMAKNLIKKGFPTTLLARPSRPAARLADLLAAGASQAPTPRQVALASDVIIVCVTGAPEVDSVVYGEQGVMAAARPGLVVVDASTSEVDASARTRAALAEKGVLFVDAPLTRTPAAAEEGKCNTMVGAEKATFDALSPVFRAYCEHIIHAGPPGHGLVLKLINNFVGQAITTATAEGLAVAAKTGLDVHALYKLMSLGSVNNLMFQFMVGKMLEGGPEQLEGLKFSLGNAEKDVRGGLAPRIELGGTPRVRARSRALTPAPTPTTITPPRSCAPTRTSPRASCCPPRWARRCTSPWCRPTRLGWATSTLPPSSRRRSASRACPSARPTRSPRRPRESPWHEPTLATRIMLSAHV